MADNAPGTLVNPSGFSFVTPQMQRPSTSVSDSSQGGKTLSGLFDSIKGAVDRHEEEMRIQGITDAVAGHVEEQSWLSKPGYDQGVKYVDYMGKVNDFQSKIQKEAQASADLGESPTEFNKRMQPHLQELNASINDLGLNEKTKQAAQESILKQQAFGIEQYEKSRQVVTKQRIEIGKAAATQAAQGRMQDNPTALNIVETLLDTQRNVFEFNRWSDPDAHKTSSGVAVNAYISSVKAINIATPEGRQALAEYNAAAQDPRLRTQLDEASYAQLQTALIEKSKAARQATGDEYGSRVNLRKANLADGIWYNTKDYHSDISDLRGRVADGTMSPADGKSYEDQWTNLYVKSQEEKARLAEKNAKEGMPMLTYAGRLASGITESKYSKGRTQEILSTVNFSDPQSVLQGSDALLKAGVWEESPTMISTGARMLTQPLAATLSMNTTDIEKGGVSAQVVQNMNQIRQRWNMYPEFRQAIIEQFPEDQRKGVQAMIEGDEPLTPDSLVKMKKGAEVSQQSYDPTYKVPQIKADDFSKKNPFRTLQSGIGQNQNVEAQQIQGVNKLIRDSQYQWSTEGFKPRDGVQAVRRLEADGKVVITSTGVIPVQGKNFWQKHPEIQGNSESKRQFVQDLRQRVAVTANGKPEDVHLIFNEDGSVDGYYSRGNVFLNDDPESLVSGPRHAMHFTTKDLSAQFKTTRTDMIGSYQRNDRIIHTFQSGGNSMPIRERINSTPFSDEGQVLAGDLFHTFGESKDPNLNDDTIRQRWSSSKVNPIFNQIGYEGKSWMTKSSYGERSAVAHLAYLQNNTITSMYVKARNGDEKAKNQIKGLQDKKLSAVLMKGM